jgi:hypothetical protein
VGLAFAGTTQINSVTFFQVYSVTFGGTTTVLPGHYKISLSTANNHGYGNRLPDNIGADNTVIFEGDLGGVSTSPSFTITSSVPFVYDPTAGDLLLDIEVTNQAYLGVGFGRNDLDITGLTQAQMGFSGSLYATVEGFAGMVTQFNK